MLQGLHLAQNPLVQLSHVFFWLMHLYVAVTTSYRAVQARRAMTYTVHSDISPLLVYIFPLLLRITYT